MTVPIQRACPDCESTVRAGGCGDRWHDCADQFAETVRFTEDQIRRAAELGKGLLFGDHGPRPTREDQLREMGYTR